MTPVAGRLREEIVVTHETPMGIRAQIADMQLEAAAEASPPHRLTGLRAYPVGKRVTDPRVAAPSTRTSGEAPEAAAKVAEDAFAELGLAGLVLDGADTTAADDPGRVWTVARGWANLDPGEALRPHAERDPVGAQIGLGWLLNQPKDVCGHAGGGHGAATSLIIRLSSGQPSVAMTNRLIPIEPVNARLVRPVA